MTASQRHQILDVLQWMGFAIVLAALPFSNFFMSFGSFWMVGAWLLNLLNAHYSGEDVRVFFKPFLSDRSYIAISAIYFLPLLGLLWSSEFGFAGWDLRMKLPILFMPFLVATMRPMGPKMLESLMWVFISALLIAVFFCFRVYLGHTSHKVRNFRDISIFISHIRFSILLVFGIIVLSISAYRKGVLPWREAAIASLFLGFLWIMESITAVIMLFVWAAIVVFRYVFAHPKKWISAVVVVLSLSVLIGGIYYVHNAYRNYFSAEPIDISKLDAFTSRGERYEHFPENTLLENGNYILLYLAWGELKQSWESRSTIPIDSLDKKGNPIKGTLARYLTSKGLRKDADAMAQLTDEEIRLIEEGTTSYCSKDKRGLNKRLDRIFFELDNYRNGGSPNGHSVFQRLEFWKTGLTIYHEHPILGVGTGDLKSSFKEMYVRQNSKLEEGNRLRAHQQYLTMFITYGTVGGLIFLGLVLYPFFKKSNRGNVIFMSFGLLFLISCLTEDTLETQAGVMFFAFFSSFLVRYFPSIHLAAGETLGDLIQNEKQ